MIEPLLWLPLLAVALVAGTIGGVVGFGSAVILLPICAYVFGAAQAVAILTVAALIGNLSRAAFSWRETDWAAVRMYVLGAAPFAAIGAFIFVELDAALIHRLLGAFILLMIPARRWAARHDMTIQRWHLLPLGAVMGLLSGVVGTVGPINAPFFLAYGLVKGAYLATEALGAAAVHLTKSAVYGRLAALDLETLAYGLVIGLALIAGSWAGKRIVMRLDTPAFIRTVEVLLGASGILMVMGV
ncbi:MAG: sulfite exporter TauE/SafE family protein [Sphingomonadaceae bacterium]